MTLAGRTSIENLRFSWQILFRVPKTLAGTKKAKKYKVEVEETCTGTNKTKKTKFLGTMAQLLDSRWKFCFLFLLVPADVWCI